MKTVFIGMTLDNFSTSDYFTNIYKVFLDKGYRVVVITDGQKNEVVDTNSNPIILTWPSKRPTKIKDAYFLFQKIRLYKPSIVISNFGSVNIMTLLSFLLKVKTRVIWVHTLSSQLGRVSNLLKFRKNIIYMMATNLIANSNAMEKDIQNTYSFLSNKTKVFPNALEIKDVDYIERDRNLIVYVGRLHISKGVDTLIKAFAKIKNNNKSIKLKIVGTGEEKISLEALVKKLDLSESISFLGSVNKEKVLELFKEANFSVVPSRNEAFGYVVIESMSLETPVVGSNVDGIAEIITDSYDGLLFQPDDQEDLYQKLLKMQEELSKSDTMRKKAFSTVNERYNVNKIGNNFVNYIVDNIEKGN